MSSFKDIYDAEEQCNTGQRTYAEKMFNAGVASDYVATFREGYDGGYRDAKLEVVEMLKTMSRASANPPNFILLEAAGRIMRELIND